MGLSILYSKHGEMQRFQCTPAFLLARYLFEKKSNQSQRFISICPVFAPCPFSVLGPHPGHLMTFRHHASSGSSWLWFSLFVMTLIVLMTLVSIFSEFLSVGICLIFPPQDQAKVRGWREDAHKAQVRFRHISSMWHGEQQCHSSRGTLTSITGRSSVCRASVLLSCSLPFTCYIFGKKSLAQSPAHLGSAEMCSPHRISTWSPGYHFKTAQVEITH